MKENLLVSILVVLIGGFFAPSLAADNNNNSNEDNSFVKFNGGIGVIPISNSGRGRRCYGDPKHGTRHQFSRSDLED